MRNISRKKLYSFYAPLLIFISIIFNLILTNYGIHYLYMLLIIMSSVGMLLDGVVKYNNNNILIVYSYISLLLIVNIFQLFFYSQPLIAIQSILMYSTLLIYWIIYFNKYSIDEFKSFLFGTVPYVYLVGAIAIIQYFFSPDLYGILGNLSKGIEWASNSTFQEYAAFFRASSILGSPQVYGLFMVLYIIVFIGIMNKNKFYYISLLFLFLSGVLSGNKSFFIIFIIVMVYKFIFANIKAKIKIFLVVLSIFTISIIFVPKDTLENIRVINRIVNVSEMQQQEKTDSRLERYKAILLNSNPLIGNGLGSKTNRENIDLKVAESYLFQIYAETGIFVFIAFLVFLFGSFLFANKKLFKDIRIMIVLIVFSMLIVHAFNSPIFFIFWGILISSYANKQKENILYDHTN